MIWKKGGHSTTMEISEIKTSEDAYQFCVVLCLKCWLNFGFKMLILISFFFEILWWSKGLREILKLKFWKIYSNFYEQRNSSKSVRKKISQSRPNDWFAARKIGPSNQRDNRELSGCISKEIQFLSNHKTQKKKLKTVSHQLKLLNDRWNEEILYNFFLLQAVCKFSRVIGLVLGCEWKLRLHVKLQFLNLKSIEMSIH